MKSGVHDGTIGTHTPDASVPHDNPVLTGRDETTSTGAARRAPGPRTTERHLAVRSGRPLSLWQLNLLRVGYLVMGGGLVVVKWPLLFTHGPWELKDGTVQCMLVALSVLALLGLRYPQRMLPILIFEVAWKLTWLGVIALPLWLANQLDGATVEQTSTVLWVVIIIAVIPWRHAFHQYVIAPGDPWRRTR